jgi:anti-sigma B factor antagonist
MFEVWRNDDGTIVLTGKLNAGQAEKARDFLATVTTTATLDCARLDYISSAGLGVLFATQRRLGESGQEIRLRNLNQHLTELFKIAGFHMIFDIGEEIR